LFTRRNGSKVPSEAGKLYLEGSVIAIQLLGINLHRDLRAVFHNDLLSGGQWLAMVVVQEFTSQYSGVAQVSHNLVHGKISFHAIRASARPLGKYGTQNIGHL